MGLRLTGQLDESKKAPIARGGTPYERPSSRARSGKAGQVGTLWRQKMQSLSLRISKRGTRRHASGAPMKRSR